MPAICAMGAHMEPLSELWSVNVDAPVTALEFGKEGNVLFAGTAEGGIHILDRSGATKSVYEMAGVVGSIAHVPGRNLFAVGLGVVTENEPSPGKLQAMDPSGNVIWMRDMPRHVRSVCFAPGLGIVAGSGRGVYVVTLENRPRWKARFPGTVMSVAYARPERELSAARVAVGGYDKTLHIMDIRGKVLWEQPIWRFINSLRFTPAGDGIVMGVYEDAALMFRVEKEEAIPIWDLPSRGSVPFVRVHPDKKRVIVATSDRHIVYVDGDGKRLLEHPVTEQITAMAVSRRWELAVGDAEGGITLFKENKREVISVGKKEGLLHGGEGRATRGEGRRPGASGGPRIVRG